MSQADDQRGLAKIFDSMVWTAVILLLTQTYVISNPTLETSHPILRFVNQIINNLNVDLHIFGARNDFKLKLIALIFLTLGVLPNRGEKKDTITTKEIVIISSIGLTFYFGAMALGGDLGVWAYILTTAFGTLAIVKALAWVSRRMHNPTLDDVFNDENESFMQETRLIENENTVNLPTKFYYKKKWRKGWINIVNPYRATMVLGTPGSGKSFAVVNNYIKQQIEKGFTMYIYDYKYPTLSEIAYNHLRLYPNGYKTTPQFYMINFDDPTASHRCNPLAPEFMEDMADAYEASYTIMLNLNRSWIQKQGDFFVDSPIILLASIIWFLKLFQNGAYCTFPHAMELLNQNYKDLFPILMSYEDLSNYLSPFMDAWQGGAQDQLQGQIGSTKIAISKIVSPALYWVMTGNDFTLDINNPEEPKVLVVGNNPDRQNIYGAALGLYNNRIVKLINKPKVRSAHEVDDKGDPVMKRTLKSSVIVDELPTIYFRGLDNLIATARSNRVAVCLGFQDISQLTRDYGDKEAKVIQNTVGNVFSGQVKGDTAKWISSACGKNMQKRVSVSTSNSGTSTSTSSQLEVMIPESKISNLTQGMFVGTVADEFDNPIDQKIFHAKILVDVKKMKEDEAKYLDMPKLHNISNEEMNEIVVANYKNIKKEAQAIIKLEKQRILEDPNLKHLFD